MWASILEVINPQREALLLAYINDGQYETARVLALEYRDANYFTGQWEKIVNGLVEQDELEQMEKGGGE